MKKAIKLLNKNLKSFSKDIRDEQGEAHDEFQLGVEQGLIDSIEMLELEDKKNSDDQRFDSFYAHYPLKKSKAPARKAFQKLNPSVELYQKIMDAVTAQKGSRQWQQKQYIPHPSTWLNQERWDDEVDTVDGLPTDDKYKGI